MYLGVSVRLNDLSIGRSVGLVVGLVGSVGLIAVILWVKARLASLVAIEEADLRDNEPKEVI